MQENVRLRRLDVSWNGFGQETAKSLSACIAENEGLVDLNLAGNRLNDEAMVIMAKGLKQNEKLEKLVVSIWTYYDEDIDMHDQTTFSFCILNVF